MTIDGQLVEIDHRPALRFERRYRRPVERVWRAVTAPEELAAWFPSEVVGERAVGAALTFDDSSRQAAADAAGEARRADGPAWTGRVITFDPPTVFAFSWGSEVLRFELHPTDDDGTLLVFTHLLSHRSVAARNGSGWHACLGALDRHLGEPGPPDDGGWDVYREFLREMGPEPGVAGPDGSLTWELGHHVDAERVGEVLSAPEELAAWGGAERSEDEVHWDVRSVDAGTVIRVTVDGAADDPEQAAAWHALLARLDMYLAAGVDAPVRGDMFRALYR